MAEPPPGSPQRPERPTALPSAGARALAFASILVAGGCGGLIGYAFSDLQCDGSCGAENTVGALAGAVIAAVGTAIVAVLVLRAMGEWEADRRELDDFGPTDIGPPEERL